MLLVSAGHNIVINVSLIILNTAHNLISAIPSITMHPQHVFNSDPGSIISLTVEALYATVYQWQINGTDLRDNTKYRGARTSHIDIHDIQEYDEGFYACIVGNMYIMTISDIATVTVCKLN